MLDFFFRPVFFFFPPRKTITPLPARVPCRPRKNSGPNAKKSRVARSFCGHKIFSRPCWPLLTTPQGSSRRDVLAPGCRNFFPTGGNFWGPKNEKIKIFVSHLPDRLSKTRAFGHFLFFLFIYFFVFLNSPISRIFSMAAGMFFRRPGCFFSPMARWFFRTPPAGDGFFRPWRAGDGFFRPWRDGFFAHGRPGMFFFAHGAPGCVSALCVDMSVYIFYPPNG